MINRPKLVPTWRRSFSTIAKIVAIANTTRGPLLERIIITQTTSTMNFTTLTTARFRRTPMVEQICLSKTNKSWSVSTSCQEDQISWSLMNRPFSNSKKANFKIQWRRVRSRPVEALLTSRRVAIIIIDTRVLSPAILRVGTSSVTVSRGMLILCPSTQTRYRFSRKLLKPWALVPQLSNHQWTFKATRNCKSKPIWIISLQISQRNKIKS